MSKFGCLFHTIMSYIQLAVSPLAQPKSDVCWHTAAQMIFNFHQSKSLKQGPMNTIGVYYSANKGITVADFALLAEKAELVPLNYPSVITTEFLANILRNYGPIWTPGFWYGIGHIIVVTGVIANNVLFIDPDGGISKVWNIDKFNEKLAKRSSGARMMVYNPDGYLSL